MSETVKLIECPRDALQSCRQQIPTAEKAALLLKLLEAGFRHLDCASFVSSQAVPQMADSEAVLERIAPTLRELEAQGDAPELIGIVLNRRGAERARRTPIQILGFPYSMSPRFQWQNARQTPEQALAITVELQKIAADTGRKLMVYLSMAFGNPFGDADSTELMLKELERLQTAGVREIALADTAGRADIELITERFISAREHFPELELGLHLHSRPEQAGEKIRRAYAAGCRRFDCALGGLGGCPFAGDRLVGNLATEAAIEALQEAGVDLSLRAQALSQARASVERIRARYCQKDEENQGFMNTKKPA